MKQNNCHYVISLLIMLVDYMVMKRVSAMQRIKNCEISLSKDITFDQQKKHEINNTDLKSIRCIYET